MGLRLLILLGCAVALSACSTIGDVAQSIADKAKAASGESSSAGTTAAAQPAAAAATPPPAPPKTEAAPAITDPRVAIESGDSFQYGGNQWLVLSRTEAGIRLQSRGWTTEKVSSDLASAHCKKYGRIAQQSGPPRLALLVFVIHSFNCVR